ncbi:MAG: hypothetical protein V3V20_12165 [Algisphaera sp.]
MIEVVQWLARKTSCAAVLALCCVAVMAEPEAGAVLEKNESSSPVAGEAKVESDVESDEVKVEAQAEAKSLLPVVDVRTTDGRLFTGALIRDVPSHVMLRIAGIETRIERRDVEVVTPRPSAAEVFAEKRSALADDDLVGRYALARGMFEENELDLAERELVTLGFIFPQDKPVKRLLAAVKARQALQDDKAASSIGDPTPGDSVPEAPEALGDAESKEPTRRRQRGSERPTYLSDAHMALVRVYEINLSDPELPRISVPAEVLQKAIAQHPNHPATPRSSEARQRLQKSSGREQLQRLFEMEARALYPLVKVGGDPESLAVFRHEINPQHVARYFEPTFGQGHVPGLNLLHWRPTTVPEAYTNFVALVHFEHEGHRMIDRFAPDESLLLQWALPRDLARHPAPDLPHWQPRFRSTTDPRYTRLRAWIDGLVKFSPDYDKLVLSLEAPQDDGKPLDAIDAIDASEASEESVESTDSVDSTEPAEPAEPVESTELAPH